MTRGCAHEAFSRQIILGCKYAYRTPATIIANCWSACLIKWRGILEPRLPWLASAKDRPQSRTFKSCVCFSLRLKRNSTASTGLSKRACLPIVSACLHVHHVCMFSCPNRIFMCSCCPPSMDVCMGLVRRQQRPHVLLLCSVHPHERHHAFQRVR